MFGKILPANDGSDPAFRALALALDIAKQNSAALHVVCVEEVPYMPEHIEEVRVAGRRFHGVLQKARSLAQRMIGSRADRLVHLAPCPVLVVK